MGISKALQGILSERFFPFDVERALFPTVLHRLMTGGSDRFCNRWRRETLTLPIHELYSAYYAVTTCLFPDHSDNYASVFHVPAVHAKIRPRAIPVASRGGVPDKVISELNYRPARGLKLCPWRM